MVDVLHDGQAGAVRDAPEVLERGVGRDVLGARSDEGIVAPLVAPIGAHPRGLAPLGEPRHGVDVVEEQDLAPAHDRRHPLQPRTRRQRDGQAGTDRHHRTVGEEVRLGRHRGTGRHEALDELRVGAVHAHLRPARVGALHDVHRQVVEELVGDHEGARAHGRQLRQGGHDRTRPRLGHRRTVVVVRIHDERPEGLVGGLEREPLPLLVAQRLRALDRHVAQRAGTLGLGPEHVGGEPAAAGADLDDEERIRAAQTTPGVVDRPGEHRPEERPDLRTGDEVAPRPTGTTPTEEPFDRVVQRCVLEVGERDRPLATDPFPETRGQVHAEFGDAGVG